MIITMATEKTRKETAKKEESQWLVHKS